MFASMKKPNRRSDEHVRKARTLLLRSDLYGQMEHVAYAKGHSMSSYVEAWMEKELAPKKR